MFPVKSLVRWFTLLSVLRLARRNPFSGAKVRSIKRLAAYNFLKRHSFRVHSSILVAQQKKKRRFHVSPVLQGRRLYGAWYSLIPVMREFDRPEYFKFLRMTPESFDWLLEKVTPILTKRSIREPISAGERLALTLRALASGDSMPSLSYLFRISEKFPMRGSEHFNYKSGHSIILFAVSDAKYKFIMVDVGSRGRESDGGVFDRSQFGDLFKRHQLQLPPPVYCEAIRAHLPYVFLGDDAFPFDVHLMKAFDESIREVPEEIVFNYRLSRARRVVENAFGILSARFRILRRNIIGSETLVQNIVLACTALHNLHLMREDSIPPKQRIYLPPGYADMYRGNGVLKRGRWRNESKDEETSIFHRLCRQEANVNIDSAHATREKFVEYCVKCPLPWQYDLLTRDV